VSASAAALYVHAWSAAALARPAAEAQVARPTFLGGTLTHDEWTELMHEVTSCMAEKPGDAARLLRELIERTEAASRDGISAWHVRQCGSLLAHIESERGELRAAAELYEGTAANAQDDSREARHAAAYGYAEAALHRFRLGESDAAMMLAERAFQLADLHVDPSATYEQLVREIRLLRARQSKGRV
jgi:hypothetical protein